MYGIKMKIGRPTKYTQNLLIDKIKPYSKNARKHSQQQIDLIIKSIKEFGFRQPIVIDKNKEIIIGHARLEAAKQ